jgi:hypothetical protein
VLSFLYERHGKKVEEAAVEEVAEAVEPVEAEASNLVDIKKKVKTEAA